MNNSEPMHLVFLLEEKSAEILLKSILSKIFDDKTNIVVRFIPFEGKQDMQKNLKRKINDYRYTNSKFIILHDQDGHDCFVLKESLKELCPIKDKNRLLIRIACHELESYYLADLNAVAVAFSQPKLSNLQKKRKFRNPDNLANAKEELKKITNYEYTEILGSKRIAPHLNINNEISVSFKHLISGIRQLLNILI